MSEDHDDDSKPDCEPSDAQPDAAASEREPPSVQNANSMPPAALEPKAIVRFVYPAWMRLAVGAACGALAAGLVPTHRSWYVRLIAGWDAMALVLIVLSWWIVWRASPQETKRRAGSEDPGRTVVWLLALAASGVSLFAAVGVLGKTRSWTGMESDAWEIVALAAVALSWVLTHTMFALRYAHLFYRGRRAGGLNFPGDKPPRDIDFAYFSFTLGMCFQVSDVSVTSSRVRRTVLLHSLISFAYNTTLLALTMNIVFDTLGH